MTTIPVQLNFSRPAAVVDVSDVVTLRRRVSRAATSLNIIGVLSAAALWQYLYDYSGWRFETALAYVVLVPGLASVTAERLRSGSGRAATLAVAWGVLWLLYGTLVFRQAILRREHYYVIALAGPLLWLAFGLIALVRGRRVAIASNDAVLMAHPWDAGRRLKARPRLLKVRGWALVLILMAPLPTLWWLLGTDPHFGSNRNLGDYWGTVFCSWLLTFVSFYFGARLYRRARRVAMLPGSALVKEDPRPLVLYLRSFDDDGKIRMRARATNGRILPEILVRISFEEVLTDHLWGYGPVLAVGDPRTKEAEYAPLGAARDFVGDSDWQGHVAELMRRASLIVAVAGKTGGQGLGWEIDAVVRGGFLSKFVLLMPPVDRIADARSRWQSTLFSAQGLNLPSDLAPDHMRAAIFSAGSATFICGKEDADWTYEAVLDQAALAILGAPPALVAEAPPGRTLLVRWLRTLAPHLFAYFRSTAAFLAIGIVILVVLVVRNDQMGRAHPFARYGELRDELLPALTDTCTKNNAKLPEGARDRYCRCYAERVAEVVTWSEYQGLEKLADSNGRRPASANAALATFDTQSKVAVDTCSKEILGR
jgi:hypothetical protein